MGRRDSRDLNGSFTRSYPPACESACADDALDPRTENFGRAEFIQQPPGKAVRETGVSSQAGRAPSPRSGGPVSPRSLGPRGARLRRCRTSESCREHERGAQARHRLVACSRRPEARRKFPRPTGSSTVRAGFGNRRCLAGVGWQPFTSEDANPARIHQAWRRLLLIHLKRCASRSSTSAVSPSRRKAGGRPGLGRFPLVVKK